MIQDKKELMTLSSKERLQEELKKLKEKLIEAGKDVGTTDGDWHDSATFDQIQREYNFIQTQVEIVEEKLKNAQIIKPNLNTDIVNIGHEIELSNGVIYTLLGPSDSDPKKGWISFETPIGQSLLCHKKGDKIGENTIVDFRAGKI